MNKICVYCGSNRGIRPEYVECARLLGRELVNREITLVYGGAKVGLMGEIASTVLDSGGDVIGIMPEALVEKELVHNGLTELIVVKSMHERKAKMAEVSDGFIALPGGLGTVEELFEVLTWSQLGYHSKPCALLNIEGYYNELALFLKHAVDEQFVKEPHRRMLLMENAPERLLDMMESYKPPLIDKWIGRNEL